VVVLVTSAMSLKASMCPVMDLHRRILEKELKLVVTGLGDVSKDT